MTHYKRKPELYDVLQRRSQGLESWCKDMGITDYDMLVRTCDNMGVTPPLWDVAKADYPRLQKEFRPQLPVEKLKVDLKKAIEGAVEEVRKDSDRQADLVASRPGPTEPIAIVTSIESSLDRLNELAPAVDPAPTPESRKRGKKKPDQSEGEQPSEPGVDNRE